MGKEKKKIEPKIDNKMYYEIIGLGMVFFSIIVISSIGKIGLGLKIIFKIIFGDWYFYLLILCIIVGILLIKKKKQFNPFSIRFHGFLLFFIAMLLYSEASFHPLAYDYGTNAFNGMYNIYLLYLKSYNDNYIFGGGFTGCFLYQIIYYLFGFSGSYLIIFLILIFSLIFISNNNLISFYRNLIILYGQIKRLYFSIVKYFKNIKRTENVKVIKSKHALNEFDEDLINKNLEEKIIKDLEYGLSNLLTLLKIDDFNIESKISYLYSQIEINGNIDFNVFKEKVKSIIPGSFYILKDNNIKIEIENRFKRLLSLKHVIDVDNNLGYSLNDEPLIFDFDIHKNILISGKENSGIKTFIRGYISSLILNKKLIEIYLLDLKDEYQEIINNKYLNISNFDQLVNMFTLEIERRLDMFNFLGVNNFNDANKEIKNNKIDCELIFRKLFILNGLEILYDCSNYQSIESKLIYLLELGSKVGIHLIIITRTAYISNLLKNSLPLKLVFKVNNVAQSMEILDNNHAIYLVGKGDFIYKYRDKEKRGQSGFISEIEYKNIIK